jgi:cytochrome P450
MTHSASHQSKTEFFSGIPGPEGYPLVGVIPKIGRDVLGFFLGLREEYGDVVHLNFGARHMILATHPNDVKYILQENNRNYAKGYDQVKPVLGNGLVSSEGEFWRRQRRLIQPTFHRRKIEGFARVMVDSTEEMLGEWDRYARSGAPLDIAAEILRLTQQIIARTMFSTDVGEQTDNLCQAFDVTLEYMNERMFNPLPFIDRMPTPTNLKFKRWLKVLDEMMYSLIENRRKSLSPPEDLLTMLLEAKDEGTGEGMTDKQIRDEVVTIFFAGHETTASTLAWTWVLLGRHPKIAEGLYQEVTEVLGDNRPTIADTKRLPYTNQIIAEALRIYPPAWMFARQSIAPDELGGFHIPAGTMIMLSPYITHRHPDFWETPEVFDPDRFAPEREGKRHRMAYFPFGGGPRLCIGKDFALVEATLILAMMAQKFHLTPLLDREVTPQPIATLRPRGGVFMRLAKVG